MHASECVGGGRCRPGLPSRLPSTARPLRRGGGRGDAVLVADPEADTQDGQVAGATADREIEATITGGGEKQLVQVIVDTDGFAGDETGMVVATDGHPFWVDNGPLDRRWTEA